MPFPWAEATPASDVNTLATTAINGVSTNLTQVINNGGEKILQDLVNKGRVFMVPEGSYYSHPLLHTDGGGTTARYDPDNFGAGATLTVVSKEILTQARFKRLCRSRNLNFPQDMPLTGSPLNYMESLVMSNAIGMMYELESEFVLGNATGAGGSVTANAPYEADDDYNAGYTMSLYSLLTSGTGLLDPGSTNPSPTSESFAGITGANAPNWIPSLASTTANGSTLIEDIDDQLRKNWYGARESTDAIYTGLSVFNKIADLVRDTATHNAGMNANLGKDGTITIGSAVIDWHRMLDTKDAAWDFSALSTAEYPILFLNMKSLRLNVVAAGTISDGGPDVGKNPMIGFLKQPVPGVHPVPDKTNLFKRVSMGHSFSLEHGRRGFGHLEGCTL